MIVKTDGSFAALIVTSRAPHLVSVRAVMNHARCRHIQFQAITSITDQAKHADLAAPLHSGSLVDYFSDLLTVYFMLYEKQ